MADVDAPRPVPRHVAIIMDGNGRWAKLRGRPRVLGHRAGVEAVRKVVRAAGDAGVETLTLFSFSTENWRRPVEEVDALIELLKGFVDADLERLAAEGVRIRMIGERERLSADLREIISRAESRTATNSASNLVIAFNYGGRDEILRAVRKAAAEPGGLEALTEDGFKAHLDTAGLPDPDLLIRTSGEHRISNFLLWQAAYAEFYFTDVLWPDFGAEAFNAALTEFARRERRYGAVKT
jgi:undecaprenyl diphosphate synthase